MKWCMCRFVFIHPLRLLLVPLLTLSLTRYREAERLRAAWSALTTRQTRHNTTRTSQAAVRLAAAGGKKRTLCRLCLNCCRRDPSLLTFYSTACCRSRHPKVSEAKALASLRDIPPVAGKILWARQMERQLRLLSMRLSDVLGEGWENHVDGRPLKAVCDELLRNLDTKRWGIRVEGGELDREPIGCVCVEARSVIYGDGRKSGLSRVW